MQLSDFNIKIKKINQNAKLPERATSGSAGFDLFACLDEPVTLKSKEIFIVGTGVCMSFLNSLVGLILPRSGLSNKRIILANSVGVLDSDYRGEIKVALLNNAEGDYTLFPFDRIAQIVFLPVICANLQIVANLDETIRGEEGFGSTGR